VHRAPQDCENRYGGLTLQSDLKSRESFSRLPERREERVLLSQQECYSFKLNLVALWNDNVESVQAGRIFKRPSELIKRNLLHERLQA
jgi:hypothetical protein